MKEINGLTIFKDSECYIVCVTEFSENIKQLLRDNLCLICHGKSAKKFPKEYNNYKSTLKELLNRLKTRDDDMKKGMIGELLTHVIFCNYFEDYLSVSPYFNLEENNIKKGFDLVLIKNNEIWINEVKSGELHSNKTSTETSVDLINTAKLDLKDRLNNGNTMLWLNAINHAFICFNKFPDEKDAIENILNTKYADVCDHATEQGKNTNVILTSVLFHDVNNFISKKDIINKKNSVEKENLFKNIFVLAIQKSTYKKVIEFLEGEAE